MNGTEPRCDGAPRDGGTTRGDSEGWPWGSAARRRRSRGGGGRSPGRPRTDGRRAGRPGRPSARGPQDAGAAGPGACGAGAGPPPLTRVLLAQERVLLLPGAEAALGRAARLLLGQPGEAGDAHVVHGRVGAQRALPAPRRLRLGRRHPAPPPRTAGRGRAAPQPPPGRGRSRDGAGAVRRQRGARRSARSEAPAGARLRVVRQRGVLLAPASSLSGPWALPDITTRSREGICKPDSARSVFASLRPSRPQEGVPSLPAASPQGQGSAHPQMNPSGLQAQPMQAWQLGWGNAGGTSVGHTGSLKPKRQRCAPASTGTVCFRAILGSV